MAQRRKKKRRKKEEEKIEWKEKLWYGGNVGMGFGGSNAQSQFLIALSPMVGYKFNKYLSAGPRISMAFRTGRIQLNTVQSYNVFDYGIGIFGRFKPFNQIFAHGEISYEDVGFVEVSPNDLNVIRQSQIPVLLGLGYTTGGIGYTGYEIMVLYDFSAPDNTVQLPIVVRVGFNYNF